VGTSSLRLEGFMEKVHVKPGVNWEVVVYEEIGENEYELACRMR